MISSPPETPSLELTFAGERFVCHDGDVIGREGTVAVAVLRRVGEMSRRHLQVELAGGRWRLTVLPTARNQTTLDGVALPRESPRTLGIGDHKIGIEGRVIYLHVGSGSQLEADGPSPGRNPALERLRDEIGEQASLLELVADNVADLIAIIDHNGKRLWNNAAYLTCLGYAPQEINDSYSMEEVHPEDLPTVKRVFDESMRTGVGQRLEYRMRHRDGHWVYLESQARVVAPASSANKYLVLVARDITKRKRDEEQERRRFESLAGRAATLAEFTRSRAFQDGDFQACFAAVTNAAVKHLDCNCAGVWLFSSDGKKLVCQEEFAGDGDPDGLGTTLDASSCEGFFAMLRTERCVVPQECADDPRLCGLHADYLAPHRVGDFLATRIGLGDEVLGMLTLEHAAGAGVGWSLDDQGFAVSLADTLLMCLHARRRAEAFAVLQESQRQIAADLAEAANYVQAVLPPPLTGDVESEWRLVPCSALGGDGLGHHWIDDDHLAIYVIDSVGHGVGASLLAISVLNILRSGSLAATNFHDPAQVLRELNRNFQMDMQNDMFFTIWYGVYHRPTRGLIYAAAAHPAAVLFDSEGTPAPLGGQGLMIGVEEEAFYTNSNAVVPAGGKLYVFSDGAYEVVDAEGKAWGYSSFVACLNKPAPPGKSEIDSVRETVQRVNGHPELPDDFSILRLTFH